MTYSKDSPLVSTGTGSPAHVVAWMSDESKQVERPTDVRGYLDEIYRLCGELGINGDIAVAQSAHETDYWRSARWAANCNPAGLGIESDSDHDPAQLSGKQAAQLHAWCLCLALEKPTSTLFDLPASARSFTTRWMAKCEDGHFPKVNTVADLGQHYVDSHGEPQAVWGWDAQYAAQIIEKANEIFPKGGTATVPTTKPELRIVLNPGHRNTTGGNPEEAGFTPALAAAYFKAFTAAGFETVNLGDTSGNLDIASKRIADQIKSAPGDCVFFDLHLEGTNEHGPRGVFCIVPDVDGLRAAAPVTQDAGDTWANNTKDRALAHELSARIAAATGLPQRSSAVRELGVMDEHETGVGADGWRLAVFGWTSPYRAKAVRLVVEHGCHTEPNDHAIIFSPGFAEKCAAAAVAAVSAVYGGATQTPAPKLETAPTIPWQRGEVGLKTLNDAHALAFVGLATANRTVPVWRTAQKTRRKDDKPITTLAKGETAILLGSFTNKDGKWVLVDLGDRGVGRAQWTAFTASESASKWPLPKAA